MKKGDIYFRFCIYKNKPFLKTYTLLFNGKNKLFPEYWSFEEDYNDDILLLPKDINKKVFDNELSAASAIYEQYKLRKQEGITSLMINKIINWDYFKDLLEKYPSIKI